MRSISCLGGLVGYGPDPNRVIDLIREAEIPTVMGNYDDGIGWERGDCGRFYATEEARRLGVASYAFTAEAVTADRKTFLQSLPLELRVVVDSARLHLVHGSPRKINEYLLRERAGRTFARIAAREKDDALVFGHTHQAWHRRYGGVLFINVGSVAVGKMEIRGLCTPCCASTRTDGPNASSWLRRYG